MKPKTKRKKPHKFKNKILEEENASDIVPISKGNIPKLAVLLGLLSPLYFNIYEKCDGKRNIGDLAKELDMDLKDMLINIDLLQKNDLIEIPN